jgi:hypothetical protein
VRPMNAANVALLAGLLLSLAIVAAAAARL